MCRMITRLRALDLLSNSSGGMLQIYRTISQFPIKENLFPVQSPAYRKGLHRSLFEIYLTTSGFRNYSNVFAISSLDRRVVRVPLCGRLFQIQLLLSLFPYNTNSFAVVSPPRRVEWELSGSPFEIYRVKSQYPIEASLFSEGNQQIGRSSSKYLSSGGLMSQWRVGQCRSGSSECTRVAQPHRIVAERHIQQLMLAIAAVMKAYRNLY